MGDFSLPQVKSGYTTNLHAEVRKDALANMEVSSSKVQLIKENYSRFDGRTWLETFYAIDRGEGSRPFQSTTAYNYSDSKDYGAIKGNDNVKILRMNTNVDNYDEAQKLKATQSESIVMLEKTNDGVTTNVMQEHKAEARYPFEEGSNLFIQEMQNDLNLDGDFDDEGETTLRLCKGEFGKITSTSVHPDEVVIPNFKWDNK